jgi:hypothetical protein
MQNKKLIHLGSIAGSQPLPIYLLLRQIQDYHFAWYKKLPTHEEETPIWGPTAEEAIRLAYKHWKIDNFRTLNCGYRYTLPERDEHGSPALFYQMIASYSSMNGIYFDEELGFNCIVHNASQEARLIWKKFFLS